MSEDDFLIFEFLDTFDNNDDQGGGIMSEKELAEKRFENFWQGVQLKGISEGSGKIIETPNLPDSAKELLTYGITEEFNFDDLFADVRVAKYHLTADRELLRQYPSKISESGSNYLRYAREQLEEQLEDYFKEVKTSSVARLKEEREEVATEISNEFQRLKGTKLEEDSKFETLYHTYRLWTSSMNQAGEIGIKPEDADENWNLIKLLKNREFQNPSSIADYIQPDGNKVNFRRKRSTLESWISEPALNLAEELYEVSRILRGDQLKKDLQQFLLKR
mgnify:CR=1 FL=1